MFNSNGFGSGACLGSDRGGISFDTVGRSLPALAGLASGDFKVINGFRDLGFPIGFNDFSLGR
jgi:hypothetical protein